MSDPRMRWLALAASAVLLLWARAEATQHDGPDLQRLLERVGTYVREYEHAFSAIVSREEYVQQARTGRVTRKRVLRSEVALVPLDGREWVLFRDVYEVDGKRVTDHPDRLARLFGNPPPDAAALARQIAKEGARYNLGNIPRTVNTPTVALMFLRSERQANSRFRITGQRMMAGINATELTFHETALPRVIVTRDDAAASGRVWVNSDDGTVLATELYLLSGIAAVGISVEYVREPKLDLWVPVRMTERYVIGIFDAAGADPAAVLERAPQNMNRIEGTATYEGFRRFAVVSKIRIP